MTSFPDSSRMADDLGPVHGRCAPPPACDQCGAILKDVPENGAFNEDQWASIRLGALYCDSNHPIRHFKLRNDTLYLLAVGRERLSEPKPVGAPVAAQPEECGKSEPREGERCHVCGDPRHVSREKRGGPTDWTAFNGRTNCSPLFEKLVEEVERLIRGDARTLMAGRADSTARLVLAQLAHVHGLAPSTEQPMQPLPGNP